MSVYDKQLGARIAEARRAVKLSQDGFSQRIHMSRGTVAMWETGRRSLHAEQVLQVAEVLRADPAWLLTGAKLETDQGQLHRVRCAIGALSDVAGVLNDLIAGAA